MVTFILVTILNTGHGSQSQVSIKARDITALRVPQSGIGCALSHKDIERELMIKEPCAVIHAQLNAKPSKASKSKKSIPWGEE